MRSYLDGETVVLALEAESGLLLRVGEFPLEQSESVARLALAWNACIGLRSDSLAEIIKGGSAGTLAERALAWSLFAAMSGPAARRFLETAQTIMKKQGGEA